MSILAELEHALGRRAELSEYAEKVEHVVEDLAGRVEALEHAGKPADPTTPSSASDAETTSAPTAPAVSAGYTTADPQGEPGQV